MAKSNIEALISEGVSIKARMKTDAGRLKEIEGEILPLGAGKYEGRDGTACTVIVGSPSIKPNEAAIEAVKNAVGEEHFKTLFDRVIGFKPVKGFRDVVNAILTPAKAKKVLGLCEAAAAPYIKWA